MQSGYIAAIMLFARNCPVASRATARLIFSLGQNADNLEKEITLTPKVTIQAHVSMQE